MKDEYTEKGMNAKEIILAFFLTLVGAFVLSSLPLHAEDIIEGESELAVEVEVEPANEDEKEQIQEETLPLLFLAAETVVATDTATTTATTTVTATATATTTENSGGDVTEYKQSFSAQIDGPQEVPPTASEMLGEAIFNVLMGEGGVDYEVQLRNGGGITGIVLGCGKFDENGPTVVRLFSSGSGVSASTPMLSGTIELDDIEDAAVTCSPNIHTVPHLIQAMREESIYINVLTEAYPEGEIRGQLMATTTVSLPDIGDGGDSGEDPDNGTSTATTTPGDGTSTTTPTTTPSEGEDDDDNNNDDNDSPRSRPGGQRRSGGSGGSSDDGEVLGVSTGLGGSCSTYLTEYIHPRGGNDTYNVALLQIFLNKHLNAGLTLNGMYDAATIQAVNEFQLLHKEDVLEPWVVYGLPNDETPTGYVYKTTRWKINDIECGTTTPMPLLP